VIVTCPGCASKYRVRNEVVPTDGARMRCPKCSTLFLAKPPPASDGPAQDDSGMFQQLDPSKTGPMPIARAGTPSPNPGPVGSPLFQPAPSGAQAHAASQGAPAAGPITAMMQAFDPAMLPPTAPPAAAPPRPAPNASSTTGSGLEIGGPAPAQPPPPAAPRVRVAAPPPAPAPVPAPPRRGGAGSWAALALGAVVFSGGATFAAWTTEVAALDGVLMPTFKDALGVRTPVDAAATWTGDELRRRAQELEATDPAAAIVLWRRARAAGADSDGRAAAAIPRLRQALGEEATDR
jgi:predicted Zn finger-like uncharacterized protein